jgi:hypothetical protein
MTGFPSYRRSLQPSNKNIQLFSYCLFPWVVAAFLDPDSDPQGSFESGSNPDPKPKHSLAGLKMFTSFCKQGEVVTKEKPQAR